jgi:hypothetical protein
MEFQGMTNLNLQSNLGRDWRSMSHSQAKSRLLRLLITLVAGNEAFEKARLTDSYL